MTSHEKIVLKFVPASQTLIQKNICLLFHSSYFTIDINFK